MIIFKDMGVTVRHGMTAMREAFIQTNKDFFSTKGPGNHSYPHSFNDTNFSDRFHFNSLIGICN
jgi:hypothetical protein